MGALLSVIQDAYFALRTAYRTIAELNAQYGRILKRINNPPAAPLANPTKPYWHHDPPFPELVDIQNELPRQADVVIIGSGITGAAAARALMELAPKPLKIVVLEARQLCSGATGRNGGHIKCTPHDLFKIVRKTLGEQRAAQVVSFYMRHLPLLKEVGEQVSEGQVREVETADFFLDEEEFEKAKEAIKAAKEWVPGFECDIWSAQQARERFGASTFVVGATSYPAGALWPYRLVLSIWNDLLNKHPDDITISTHTAVEAVAVDTESVEYIHQVKTSKGIVASRHVLHATNAYAPYLVPSLLGRLAGFKGHMTAQRPGEDFPVQRPARSWSIIHEPDYEYITQLTADEAKEEKQGLLMVGGAFMRSQKQGVDQWGNWDDTTVEAMTTMVNTGSMETVLERWGRGGGVVSVWSGIIGMTGDLMPFVGRIGEVDRKIAADMRGNGSAAPGQWVSAGYSGEGMVSAWLSATAVAIMILGLEDVELEQRNGIPGGKLEGWFPKEEFGLSSERMRRANLKNLAEEFA